eukprot:757154-Hanusia_phi.AAC.1
MERKMMQMMMKGMVLIRLMCTGRRLLETFSRSLVGSKIYGQVSQQRVEPDQLFHSTHTLIDYDKDNIPVETIKKIKTYTTNPDFNPEVIIKVKFAAGSCRVCVIALQVSKAATGLCKWVRAMEVYDNVAK